MLKAALLLLVSVGCPYVSADRHHDRLDVDADGVAWPDDCDEEDPTVYPGADEVCGDGVQNDCGIGSTECRITSNGAPLDTLADVHGAGSLNSAFGWATASGDLDTKQGAELVVGAPLMDGVGRVYVFSQGTADPTRAWRTLVGNGRYLGFSVAALPGALAVGDPGNGLGGAVYVISDLQTRPASSQAVTGTTTTGVGVDQSAFGASMARVGDALLVGAYGGYTVPGAAYLFLEPAVRLAPATADAKLAGPASALAGFSVAATGDVDGDGADEMTIGGTGESSVATSSGAAWVVPASTRGVVAIGDAAVATIFGQEAGDLVGYRVAGGGDVDDDGYADLLVGGTGLGDTGAVLLFSGPVAGTLTPADATATFVGAAPGDQVGGGVSGGFDMDLDGHPEVAIGAGGSDLGGDNFGAVWVFYGPDLDGTLGPESADLVLYGTSTGSLAGWGLAVHGDLDGDGPDDLVVGAPATGISDLAGAVFIVRGRSL